MKPKKGVKRNSAKKPAKSRRISTGETETNIVYEAERRKRLATRVIAADGTAEQVTRIMNGGVLSLKEWGELKNREGVSCYAHETEVMAPSITEEMVKENALEAELKTTFCRNGFGVGDATPMNDKTVVETMVTYRDREATDGIEKPASNPKTLMGQLKVPNLSVIPPASIIAQGIAMRYGAFLAPRTDGKKGYGPYNWRDQPIEAHVYIDAAIRHLMQWFDGEDFEHIYNDKGERVDSVSHLGFAVATIGILIDAFQSEKMIDDRPWQKNRVATRMLEGGKLRAAK